MILATVNIIFQSEFNIIVSEKYIIASEFSIFASEFMNMQSEDIIIASVNKKAAPNKRFGVSRGVCSRKVLREFESLSPVRAFVFPRPNAKPPTVVCKRANVPEKEYELRQIVNQHKEKI